MNMIKAQTNLLCNVRVDENRQPSNGNWLCYLNCTCYIESWRADCRSW